MAIRIVSLVFTIALVVACQQESSKTNAQTSVVLASTTLVNCPC
jgi:hypothetical protein